MDSGREGVTNGEPRVVLARFGPFELDFCTAELRKNGRKIRLQEQPFQILRILLEARGELVSREDIRKRLWPDGTVVEFDHSINAAIKRLRSALSDSADTPRYIETLPRRGYRFLGEVDTSGYAPAADPPMTVPDEPPAPAQHPRVRLLRPILAALTAIGLIAIIPFAGFRTRTERPVTSLRPLVRLDMNLGSDPPAGSPHGADAILSPDGARLVYVSQSKLYVRRLDQATATELPGTDRAAAPFFSPDGQWVSFFAASRLKKVSLQTGQAVDLAGAPLSNGGSWGDDGTIVMAGNVYLTKLSARGGAVTPVTELRSGEVAHRWPDVLPGAKAVLFTAYRSMSGLETASIEAYSLTDGSRKTVLPGASFGRYAASGHLIYVAQGRLFAVPFDPDRLEAHGSPTPVIEEVAAYSTATGAAQFDISHNGTLVYRRSKAGTGLVTVQWLDASGETHPLLPVPGNYLSPTLSPDGKRLALTSGGDIWVYELRRGSMIRLSFGGGYANPLWTPDGRFIVFRSARELLWTRADGSGQPRALIENPGPGTQIPWSFAPEGRRLMLVRSSAPGQASIWILPISIGGSEVRSGKAELFLERPFAVRGPAVSPNGRWIAYASNESGRYSIYVEPFPEGGRKQRVSGDGAICVEWSRSGHEIFFYGGDEETRNRLMVVALQPDGDSLAAGRPRVWSPREVANFPTTRSYDPAPDGKRVVALLPADSPEDRQDRLVFLLNFFDELRRRMPPR